jgi:sec-independent protein translocase protein TatB
MFFDLSPLELLVLGVLAVVLFGPDRLPEAARTAARIMQHVRTLQAQAARSVDPRALFDDEVVEELRQSRNLMDSALKPPLDEDGGSTAARRREYANSDIT